MKKLQKRPRKSYPPEFKAQAIELAKEIGIAEAASKLGMNNVQSLGNWVRYDQKIAQDAEFRELEDARSEIKRLKKELEIEKKSVSILKSAAAFFCQDQLK